MSVGYVCVYHVCFRTEEDVEPAGARVTVSCEHSCECWELNSDLVQEHPALLTTGPSLRPLLVAFNPGLQIGSDRLGTLEVFRVHFPLLLG